MPRNRPLPVIILCAVLGGLWLPFAAGAHEESCTDPEYSASYACRQVVIRHGPGFDIDQIRSRYRLTLLGGIPQLERVWLEAPEGAQVDTLIRLLELEQGVLDVERNEEFADPICTQLNGAFMELRTVLQGELHNQAALQAMNAVGLQPSTGEGVLVAVLDTGVSRLHPFLSSSLETPGIDLVDGTFLADDSFNGVDDNQNGLIDEGWGHGTAVAGLIHLVAPSARILPVRVLDDECEGTAFALAEGIVRSVERGARVLNVSLGAAEENVTVEAALRYADERDVLVIASAGAAQAGEGGSEVSFPAEEEPSVAVTAVDDLLVAPDWVVYDEEIALSAPGVEVLTSYRSGYARSSGSSFSTAFVSGAAAALRAEEPSLSSREVLRHLRLTALPVDAFNPEELQGRLGAGVPDFQELLAQPPGQSTGGAPRHSRSEPEEIETAEHGDAATSQRD